MGLFFARDYPMTKIIYIVDDEQGVRETLKYLFKTFDPTWKVVEFSTASEAVEAVRSRPPQLVLADQTMPGMSGTQMLEIIRQIAPATIRIILSAYPAHPEKITAAHQYLSKPFDHRELEKRIRQALAAQECLHNPELAQLVASLQSFPALPGVYVELLHELESEDSSCDRMADLLRNDGGSLTRTLQMANSPLFCGSNIITEPTDALLVLGTSVVKALVLSLHVFNSYSMLDFPELSLESLWSHSWKTAQAAQKLCREHLGEEAGNDAFFAGLVHDLGCLILMENHTERFRHVCQRAVRERLPLHEAELAEFRTTHAELSGFMLRLWGMPPTVVEAATYCAAPWKSPRGNEFTPTVALYMADTLTRQQSPPDALITPELERSYLASVGAPDVCGREEPTI